MCGSESLNHKGHEGTFSNIPNLWLLQVRDRYSNEMTRCSDEITVIGQNNALTITHENFSMFFK
jgi:hypothetical protein